MFYIGKSISLQSSTILYHILHLTISIFYLHFKKISLTRICNNRIWGLMKLNIRNELFYPSRQKVMKDWWFIICFSFSFRSIYHVSVLHNFATLKKWRLMYFSAAFLNSITTNEVIPLVNKIKEMISIVIF